MDRTNSDRVFNLFRARSWWLMCSKKKCLLTINISYKYWRSGRGRRKTTTNSETFMCPYIGCRKVIHKPLVLIDSSKMPRETFYACPHCNSPLEIIIRNGRHPKPVSFEASKEARDTTPQRCSHQLGYLTTLAEGTSFPDGCLACPEIVKCLCKK